MIKQGILIIGTICEAVTVFPGERSLGRGSNYGNRIARLRELDVIDERAMILLLWLWKKRNQIHLHLNEFAEYSHYELQDWYKSVTAWHALRDGLQLWRGK